MLFISHNSKDKRVAEELLLRAIERGYNRKQVFLDSEPGFGIGAGELWEFTLHDRLKQTRAMFVTCSANWVRSQWCFIELGYARAMAISIFPVIMEKCISETPGRAAGGGLDGRDGSGRARRGLRPTLDGAGEPPSGA